MVLQVIAGPDEFDSTARQKPLEPLTDDLAIKKYLVLLFFECIRSSRV